MTETRTPNGALVITLGDTSATIRRETRRAGAFPKFRVDFNRLGKTLYLGSYTNERAAANTARGILERGEMKERLR